MDMYEKTISSQSIFKGVIVDLRVDQIQLPNGDGSIREVVSHPGGVCVVPYHDDGTVTVVKQFRYPFGQVVTELPAGKLEYGEDHRLCALRELSEEVGAEAADLTYLGAMYTSPGFSSEVLHMYLARELKEGASHPDEDEFLEGERMPFSQLVEQVMSGEITDGKTIATVLKVKTLLNL